MKREELGVDPDSTDVKDLQLIYGAPEEGAMGGGLGGGMGLGGGFGGAELGMSGTPEAGGEAGAAPSPGAVEGQPK